MIEHLDRIEELGFLVSLDWNRNIRISILNGDDDFYDIVVLNCSYQSIGVSYEDIVETCCDFFYSWYNKNLKILLKYESTKSDIDTDKLVDSSLGDITKQVYRDFNLDSLFS
jgi:hypothetical protein